MKIYTRGGDRGETGLLGGVRVSKDVLRLEVCGSIDELNGWLGLVRAESLPDALSQLLGRLQHELFVVGAELAAPNPGARRIGTIGPPHVETIEREIDGYEATLSALREFILPGGSRAAAALHVARSVCRRAERRLVTLAHSEPEAVPSELLVYLNRLGDLLFVLARAANVAAGVPDVPWKK